jgi:hypothetical protein
MDCMPRMQGRIERRLVPAIAARHAGPSWRYAD